MYIYHLENHQVEVKVKYVKYIIGIKKEKSSFEFDT